MKIAKHTGKRGEKNPSAIRAGKTGSHKNPGKWMANGFLLHSILGVLLLSLIHILQAGPYPYPLKQRILGDRGHLSNERAGQLLCSLIHDDLQAVVLGHLSKENNMPELAYEEMCIRDRSFPLQPMPNILR